MDLPDHRSLPHPLGVSVSSLLEPLGPVLWPSVVLGSKRFLDGGYRSGRRNGHMEACVHRSSVTTSDCDLRWVPPGVWAALAGSRGKHLRVVLERKAPTEKLMEGNLGFRSYVRRPENVVQRSLEKKNKNDMDPEVSVSTNTQKAFHKIASGLSMVMANVAGIMARYVFLSNAIYTEGLKPVVTMFIWPYSKTMGIYCLIRVYFNPNLITLVVIVLVELIWSVFKRNREGMEAYIARIMAGDPLSKNSSSWFEASANGMIAVLVHNPKERLFDGEFRIIIFNLFGRFVHAVLFWPNMCLFSVLGYTVLSPAKHGPVQFVWTHCSSLGWSGDSLTYCSDDCAFMTILMLIVLLELLLFSRNLFRNHLYIWIPREAYLAARWFAKASLDGVYLFIWVP